jgi:hypothetical protein
VGGDEMRALEELRDCFPGEVGFVVYARAARDEANSLADKIERELEEHYICSKQKI